MTMHIAFVIDLPLMEGLGATLTSLVRNCSDTSQLDLHFICNNLGTRHKNNILMLLQTESYHGRTRFYDFDAQEMFGHLSAAHGFRTSYGRFLLPKLLDVEYVLCLDPDLLILLDVITFDQIRFEDHFLAAVPGGPFRNTLESKLLPGQLCVCKDERSFISGMLLLNLRKWKEQDICHEIEKICLRHGMSLHEADNTVLNTICNGNFHHIDDRFNCIWTPGQATPSFKENAILHFAGAPKPWDFLGREVHAGYQRWADYDTTFWDRRYKRVAFAGLQRIWKIRKSLIRHWLKSFRATDSLKLGIKN